VASSSTEAYTTTEQGRFPFKLLSEMTREQVISANRNPLEFLCPLTRAYMRETADLLSEARYDLPRSEFNSFISSSTTSRWCARHAMAIRERMALQSGLRSLLMFSKIQVLDLIRRPDALSKTSDALLRTSRLLSTVSKAPCHNMSSLCS